MKRLPWDIIPPGDGRSRIVFKNTPPPDLIEHLGGVEFNSVILHYGRWPDLSFLRERRHDILELIVRGDDVDWDTVSSFDNLRILVIETGDMPRVDIGAFNKLFYLQCYWSTELPKQLTTCPNVQVCRIHKFVGEALEEVTILSKLKRLSIIGAGQLTTLAGIQQLSKLEYVECVNCPKLVSIGVASACKSLRVLNIEKCKRVSDVSGLQGAANLEELLLVADEVGSLAPLRNLRCLKRLRFECKVTDGDLRFLFEMPELEFCLFRASRNFNVRVGEIRSYLERKGFDQAVIRSSLESFPHWNGYSPVAL